MYPPSTPPANLNELLNRAQAMAGFTLGELATLANIAIPSSFKRHKGWSGQLLELWLGAEAGSKPQQDFPALGVELKSIPIDETGYPLETTYVCYTHLTGITHVDWESSNIRNKLAQVLWVPIQGDRSISPADRQIGNAFLWQPSPSQLAVLQQDWEEIMEKIALGQIESITARQGEALQLRPKAANGRALTDAIGQQGKIIKTRPRGFYLKKNFTYQIIQQAFDPEHF